MTAGRTNHTLFASGGEPADYPPGTLRYIDEAGKEFISSPRSLLYSTYTMLAQEFWNGACWERVHEPGQPTS